MANALLRNRDLRGEYGSEINVLGVFFTDLKSRKQSEALWVIALGTQNMCDA